MKDNGNGGVGFVGLLSLTFIILKFCGVINWPWLWVLSPIWITIVIVILLILLIIWLRGY